MAIKFGRPLERKIGFVPVEQEAREAPIAPLSTLRSACDATGAPNGPAGWCASTC